MGVEDGELVAVVLEKPDRGIDVELEAVRRGRPVAARPVALGRPAPGPHDAAGLVRLLGPSMLFGFPANGCGHYHQSSDSISASASSGSQKGDERYFQPPSARIVTTTPSSSSSASLRATWTTAPAETPAKTPSRSTKARPPATASAFETRSLRSSFDTSRIGGT